MRAHKWHGVNQTVMLFNLPQPMGLVTVHPARQPAGMVKIIYTNLCCSRSIVCVNTLRLVCWLFVCVIIFSRKPLLEESLHSYLPAFCCGTELLLVRLPLRLDTGSRPNHLHQRYASCQIEKKNHHSVWWKRKSGQMHLISWYTHKAFILEQKADMWKWRFLHASFAATLMLVRG